MVSNIISSAITIPIKRIPWSGWTMAFAAIIAFSTTPPIARAAIESGMNPTTLLAVRYLLATFLLGGTLGLTAGDKLRIDRKGLLLCGAAGLASGMSTVSFFWALTRLSASIATMLVSVYPLVVLGLLALRGEKFTHRNTVRLALGLGGIYLILGPGGRTDWIGVALVLVTACIYAIQLVGIQWFLRDYDARAVSFFIAASTTIVVIGFWLAQGAKWQDPHWQGWLAIGVLAVVGTYLARLAMFSAVRGIGSGQTALLAPPETLLTVIWSLLFLHERLTVLQWFGGILIVFSMLLAVERLYRVQLWPRLIWRLWPRL